MAAPYTLAITHTHVHTHAHLSSHLISCLHLPAHRRPSLQVIISDVDVMWLRDPQPFFQRFPDADVLTSTDHLTPTVGAREELEMYAEAGSAFNIGERHPALMWHPCGCN